MNIFQAAALGAAQGITEFLPISSSGHLVLFQHAFGLTGSHLGFDIAVHLGTLAAVAVFFFREIRAILLSLWRYARDTAQSSAGRTNALGDPDIRVAALVAVGSIPTAMIGLGFHRAADSLFSSVFLVGTMLIITGLLLLLTRWVGSEEKDLNAFAFKHALAIGLIQGIAILPGISRSGATISLALFLGIRKELAATFSFLLSIPAISGAGIIMVKEIAARPGHLDPLAMLTGTSVSFLVGYLSLSMLVFMIKKGRLHFFAPYCWVLGAAIILLN